MTLKHTDRGFILLSHRKIDGTQEQWNNAMAFFPQSWRWHFANVAAHNYTLVEIHEGLIAEFFDDTNRPEARRGRILDRQSDEHFAEMRMNDEHFAEMKEFLDEQNL